MRFLFYVLISLFTIEADLPIVIEGENCPDVSGKPMFDATHYTGQWYQLSSLPFIFVSSDSTCVWAKYTSLSNGNIGVNNSGINPSTGERFVALGEAALIANSSGRGELDVEFYPRKPSPSADPNYFVLNTDYMEFSYIWSCDDYFNAHEPKLWILNRSFNHTLDYIHQQEANALEILKGLGYSQRSVDLVAGSLDITKHTNCDY